MKRRYTYLNKKELTYTGHKYHAIVGDPNKDTFKESMRECRYYITEVPQVARNVEDTIFSKLLNDEFPTEVAVILLNHNPNIIWSISLDKDYSDIYLTFNAFDINFSWCINFNEMFTTKKDIMAYLDEMMTRLQINGY